MGGPGARASADTGGRNHWTWLVALGAAAVYSVSVLGSTVHDQYVGGWPLIGGQLIPDLTNRTVALHFGHRLIVAMTFVYVLYLAARVVRQGRSRIEVVLIHSSLALFSINVGLGAAHVFTQVQSTGLVVAHLLAASLSWSALVAATSASRSSLTRPPHRPATFARHGRT